MKKMSLVLAALFLTLLVSCSKAIKNANEKALTIKCFSNLKQIGLGIAMYTDDNADKYPMANEWEKVLMQYIGDENTLKCPKDQHSYRFFGNGQNRAKTQDPKSTIVLICECSHQGKTNACFVDGHVEAVASEQVEKAIKTTNSEELPILQ